MRLLNSKKCKIFTSIIIIIFAVSSRIINLIYIPLVLDNKIKKIENYLKICSSNKYLKIEKVKLNKIPKISIITPLYNTGKFILRLLRSIQYQKFRDLEIIIIDDCSEDDSVTLIENYKKDDKRINLIKNKNNKGTFSSRNIGILKSKGNFLILPDSDDILLENVLYYFYNLAIKYDYEIIRFNAYITYGKTFFGLITDNLESRVIYQPELSTYIFYGLGHLKQVDYNIWNKFIKREALIRALNTLNKNELNLYMTCHEDGLLNYILYRTAKSYYFEKKFGYYYIKNNYKKRKGYYNFNNIKYSFIHIMNVFNYSKNTKYEKDMTNEIFKRLIYKKRIKDRLALLNREFKFFIEIINILNENEFFLNKYKKYLIYFKIYFFKKLLKFI